MVSLRGKYVNGMLTLEKEYPVDKPVDVIVTFLETDVRTNEKPLRWEDFSFDKVQELLKDVKGNLSDDVIEERREGR